LAGACDDEYGFFCEGDWVDTLQIPSALHTAGAVVRFVPSDFTGDMVIHCHYLIHEDQGCLSYAKITP
jgi:FtsP/CotA-like multicopper oxidase with cupredoxin domain